MLPYFISSSIHDLLMENFFPFFYKYSCVHELEGQPFGPPGN